MVRVAVAVGIVALSLGGCVAAAQERQLQSARAKDDASCRALGGKTQEQLFQCRVTFENQRRNATAMLEASEDTVGDLNRQIMVNNLIYGRR